MKRNLVLFPRSFPYEKGDTNFIKNEIWQLAEKFEMVNIIHFSNPKKRLLELPLNVKIYHFPEYKKSWTSLILNAKWVIKILISELKNNPFKIVFKYLKSNLIILSKVNSKITILKKHNLLNHNDLFYSYWMNEHALMLSIAKDKNLINKFIFRVHGFDLFNEFRPDNYIPFRDFNMKHVTKVFTVSKAGFDYLVKKVKFPEKVENSYLGTPDYGIGLINHDEFTLVSCSSINKRKRVDLIIDALTEIKDLKIHWIHFGGKGNWGNEKDLLNYASKLPPNIKFTIKGFTLNEELIGLYKSKSVSAFIHLSETEGGPSIACVEAISFGIPLIATTVGGLKETINDKTGIPLSTNPKLDEVINSIYQINTSKFQNKNFRNQVREFWVKNFDASETGKKFSNNLTSI